MNLKENSITEVVTESLIEVLCEKNPGLLLDEARGQAEAVMMYYEDIKLAEVRGLMTPPKN